MTETVLVSIASVFLLGVGAQWLAWRFKLPSILLLLLFGFLAGPVTGLLSQEALEGTWLFPFVSISVGIILFEGGLSLRLDELSDVGASVRNLITMGVVVTWVGAGLAAYYLAGFSLSVSVVLGALLTVTGPTVVIPLLRHVRPAGRVGTIAKWEGITIDPVGAILAVLVLETVLLLHVGGEMGSVSSAIGHAFEGLLFEIVVGVGVAALGAGLMILMLRRRLVPDFLQNPIALMTVVAVFAISDTLQHESGLLATTLMGIVMANQRYVSIRRIVEFKEDLRTLLISFLFIILSARLELSDVAYVGTGTLLFLAALMLVVRPAAVFFSSLGTTLTWREQAFLSWLAPRGIVAAAVASLFSFRLQEVVPLEAERFVPVVFLVIVGTVAVYGLTIAPLARWMGLAQPNPQGVLFLGAHAWARRLGKALKDQGFRVLLIDANEENVRQARADGLEARRGNALSEHMVDELNLSGIGRLLALTPNDEVNSLASVHFFEVFESIDIYQISTRTENQRDREGELPKHLRGRNLFGSSVTYDSLTKRFAQGAEVRALRIEAEDGLELLGEEYGSDVVPLFVVRSQSGKAQSQLRIVTEEDDWKTLAEPGDTLLLLVGAGTPVEELRTLAAGHYPDQPPEPSGDGAADAAVAEPPPDDPSAT